MKAAIAASVFLMLIWSTSTQAQTGFSLPSASASAGQDEFHAADGTSCRTTMDGMKRVEVGSYGAAGNNPLTSSYLYNYPYSNNVYGQPSAQKNAGVYARFSMSLDASNNRMDCTKLYELELERRRIEIEIMKRSLVVSDQKLDELKRREPVREEPVSKVANPSAGLRGSYPPL
ncbi:hypothetical protein [Methylobacterium sp. WL6]|uniref:hypothetical protein n=1 Tax=Methylobacterium sp. WL6 TaxID=2603901 RepID=UPI0011C898C7|nr:hypothetical protein [Methylobacterium sp. WL6]TXN62783.1 hypothetical protein FV230_21195 [Methylobacterium sp. WL6]